MAQPRLLVPMSSTTTLGCSFLISPFLTRHKRCSVRSPAHAQETPRACLSSWLQTPSRGHGRQVWCDACKSGVRARGAEVRRRSWVGEESFHALTHQPTATNSVRSRERKQSRVEQKRESNPHRQFQERRLPGGRSCACMHVQRSRLQESLRPKPEEFMATSCTQTQLCR